MLIVKEEKMLEKWETRNDLQFCMLFEILTFNAKQMKKTVNHFIVLRWTDIN